ncbi:MAG: sugar ABC transporter permease [Anaerolineae bacterium]|nr:sugar ABC transporter permease [Anaerolineae bacterium]
MSAEPKKSWGDVSLADILQRITLRLVVSLIVPVITFVAMWQSFIFMRDSEASKVVIAVVALVVGVGGVWILYLVTNNLVEQTPVSFRDALRPYVFVGPALVVLVIYLVYPAVNTIVLSFQDARSENFVGFSNYTYIFTEPDMLIVLRNNILWIITVVGFTVGLGLIIAVLVDRIGRWESAAKSLIFVPMAISAVGASVIWGFMYAAKPANKPQIGLLNAINVTLGNDPILYMNDKAINNFALIAIMIWLLTGYCMVVISAAVKGVPTELLEAGRIDGANEFRVFFNIIIPVIRSTLITVATTVFIMVLKVFDIVYVMTNGRRDTEVVANRMFNEFFKFGHYGRGSALAVLLLIVLLPIIYSNVRDLRERRKG